MYTWRMLNISVHLSWIKSRDIMAELRWRMQTRSMACRAPDHLLICAIIKKCLRWRKKNRYSALEGQPSRLLPPQPQLSLLPSRKKVKGTKQSSFIQIREIKHVFLIRPMCIFILFLSLAASCLAIRWFGSENRTLSTLSYCPCFLCGGFQPNLIDKMAALSVIKKPANRTNMFLFLK